MVIDPPMPRNQPRPLEREAIEARVRNCPRLPSLRSIDSAMRELLNADQRYTSQISEVVRRDPSLTARLLRLVNSVYYGHTTTVNNIEEAVFYLGVRQIRQLAMVTPVLEDFQKLAGRVPFAWREFWRHSIGTAMLTREVTNLLQSPPDEVDYVAGLVHDVGKIVMASAFPEYFEYIHTRPPDGQDLITTEQNTLGVDHAELGAIYLQNHNLPDVLVETARCHHQPERAGRHAQIVAAVQIANLLVHHAHLGQSGHSGEVTTEMWQEASGWGILFPQRTGEERLIAHAQLKRSLERIPLILDGLV